MKKYECAFDVVADKSKSKLMLEKSNLMNSILDKIKDAGISQSQAADIMRVTQPRVSDLSRGKISKFSMDLLFVMNEKLKEELE